MIEITVSGAAEERVAADQVQLVASVSVSNSAREAALEQVAAMQARLVDRAKSLVADGSASKYASEAVSTYSNSWRNEQGETTVEHHAQSTVRMLVTALDRVGELAAELTDMGANMQVNWELSQELRADLTRNLRSVAVGDARAAAQDYAEAIGAGSIHMVSLRDGRGGGAGPRPMAMSDARMAMASAPEVTLGEVSVSVNLEATFNVS